MAERAGWWERTVVPRLVDRSLRSAELVPLRRRACAPLTGRVLEVGFGSGLNCDLYPDAVAAVDAVEPSDTGWALSEDRRNASTAPVRRTGLDGQRLEAGDGEYDAALSTFTLCTVPDLAAVLAEVRRVVRPGGLLCFLEHGLAPQPGVARWQRRLEPVQRRLAGGCHLTRPVATSLVGAGFEVVDLEESFLPGVPAAGRPLAWLSVGHARTPA